VTRSCEATVEADAKKTQAATKHARGELAEPRAERRSSFDWLATSGGLLSALDIHRIRNRDGRPVGRHHVDARVVRQTPTGFGMTIEPSNELIRAIVRLVLGK
jgi:hypothetical protein